MAGGGTLDLATNLGNATLVGGNGHVFTNIDNTIAGDGYLGAGDLTLINRAAGVIKGMGILEGADNIALTIDTGANTIVNAGLIESSDLGMVGSDFGNLVIASPIRNGGVLEVAGEIFEAELAVTGTGSAVIDRGTLVFAQGFNENVAFTGTSGILELAKSVDFHKSVSGFSATGGTSLDLGDIAFVNSDEAAYSGSATSGALTVTDGIHTAFVKLDGDYLGATFTASSDGHDGTDIVATTPAWPASTHKFIAAAAVLDGGAAGSSAATRDVWRIEPQTLVRPGTMIA